MNAHLTIAVPASAVTDYRNLAGTWAAGAGMFLTPLADASDPTAITHYISSGAIDADISALLDDPASFVAEINAITGGSMTEAEAQDLRDAMDIAYLPESGKAETETVQQTLDRLGLVFVTSEDEI